MTDPQKRIMQYFRRYRVRANEMLFFNQAATDARSREFYTAMASLVQSGHVVEERRSDAYSLTTLGYRQSLKA